MRSWPPAIALALVLLSAGSASAAIKRFAVIIGNDSGEVDEPELRFAERDARRVLQVLRDLGDFGQDGTVLLTDADAATARRTLTSVNDRIRAQGRDETVLVVYYSGHGDAESLHLAGSRLPLRELRQLMQSSPATFRVLIVDSCRSGSVTRAMGGHNVEAFPIVLEQELGGEGVVFLTASAADEDAQESDELQGSFFTHYLVSGLMGAADADGDGRVDLGEAYRHAYAATLRASSRSLAGMQHPTYRYAFSGHGALVLTEIAARGRSRGVLEFPAGRTYLVLAGGAEGAVVAEVGARDRVRSLSVRPARYHVVARGRRFLLEGGVSVAAGERHRVRDGDLQRVEYARLVRRGGSSVTRTHGFEAGYRFRTPLVRGASACHGLLLGYAVDFEELSVGTRLSACRGRFENAYLEATTDELDLELRASRTWDLAPLSVDIGVGAGGAVLLERFRSRGSAPSRDALAGHVGASLGLSRDLVWGTFAGLGASLETYFFRLQETSGRAELVARFALVATVQLGARL